MMENTEKFNRAVSRAEPHEKLLIEFAREHFRKPVEDMRENLKFQEMDADFVVIHKNPGWEILEPYEIKVDFYPENNFWFEIVSNKFMDTLGCCLKTQAKYLWYYFPQSKALYQIPVKDMQEFLRNEELTKQYLKHGGDSAIGVCIPIKTFMDFVPCHKIDTFI